MPTGQPYPEYLTSESMDEPHRKIVDYVEHFRKLHEWGPTAAEITAGVGSNIATVRTMMERLLRSGYLVRPGGSARTHTRTLRVAKADERGAALLEGWLAKLRVLPKEEKRAAVEAAEKVRHEMREAAGEGKPQLVGMIG